MHEERLKSLSSSKRALFDALRAQRAQGAPLAGVDLLRAGAGDALVLVHPVGGELLCYGDLVRRLPPGHPVYGLAADAMLRGADPPDLVTLAQHYVSRLDRAGVRPALVAGWSFGGMVAYEMARLLGAGGRASRVAVIDAMPSVTDVSDTRVTVDLDLVRSFAADLMRSAGRRPEDLGLTEEAGAPTPESATRLLHERLTRVGGGVEMSVEELGTRLRVYANAATALRRHHPAPDGPPLRLLWAGETAADLAAWWRDVSGAPASGTMLAGDHYTLLRPPAVEEVARFLHEALTEASAVPAMEDENGA